VISAYSRCQEREASADSVTVATHRLTGLRAFPVPSTEPSEEDLEKARNAASATNLPRTLPCYFFLFFLPSLERELTLANARPKKEKKRPN
jgi:hypothetical protein